MMQHTDGIPKVHTRPVNRQAKKVRLNEKTVSSFAKILLRSIYSVGNIDSNRKLHALSRYDIHKTTGTRTKLDNRFSREIFCAPGHLGVPSQLRISRLRVVQLSFRK